MQTEQLKSSGHSEEEDRRTKNGPKVKMQLANLLQPNCPAGLSRGFYFFV